MRWHCRFRDLWTDSNEWNHLQGHWCRVYHAQWHCDESDDTVLRDHDQQRLAESLVARQRIQEERLEDQVRVETQEAGYLKRTAFGFLLWLAIIVAVIVVCAVGIFALIFLGTQR